MTRSFSRYRASLPSSNRFWSTVFAHALPKHSNILLAGHDTTASTLSWFLWEIAKHPESQERIRTEVAAFREQKGEEQPTAADLDNMTYTQAALKVLPRRTIQELPFSSDDWLFSRFRSR